MYGMFIWVVPSMVTLKKMDQFNTTKWSMANVQKNHVKLSEHAIYKNPFYITFISTVAKLCPEQVCELMRGVN